MPSLFASASLENEGCFSIPIFHLSYYLTCLYIIDSINYAGIYRFKGKYVDNIKFQKGRLIHMWIADKWNDYEVIVQTRRSYGIRQRQTRAGTN